MINALQHVGQGVGDVDTTYAFYKRNFGYKIKLNDLTVASKELEPVLGSVETMRMMMAANVKGGGIIERIEHKSKPITSLPEGNLYGHCGILEIGYSVLNLDEVVSDFQSRGIKMLTPIQEIDLGHGRRWRTATLKDPDGLPLQLTEDLPPGAQPSAKAEVHGVNHVGIGVSDLERSISFYQSVLEFDRLLCTFEGFVPEKDPVTGDLLQRKMAILERSADACGPLAGLLPRGAVKLIEIPAGQGRHIYEGRLWGDVGCILRGRAKITSHFRIPSSGHLRLLLNRKILNIAGLCLRSCSIIAAESDPNPGAKPPSPQHETIGHSPWEVIFARPLKT